MSDRLDRVRAIVPSDAVARRLLGPPVRRLEREVQWWSVRSELARAFAREPLPCLIAAHETPLIRELPGIDLRLQHNKVTNLRIAADCLEGMLLRPNERLSFWRRVGAPTVRRGFVEGLVLKSGRLSSGVGGGLCQMTNLLFWITLHTPLQVVERWRHSFDVFPDTGRTQPFGSGATCAWPSLDLQIVNPTSATYRLSLAVGDTHLRGEWSSDAPIDVVYRVEERDHRFVHDPVLGFVRHNEIWQIAEGPDSSSERRAVVNDAILMYQPFLAGAETETR